MGSLQELIVCGLDVLDDGSNGGPKKTPAAAAHGLSSDRG